MRDKVDLAILGAVYQEVASAQSCLEGAKKFRLAGEAFQIGKLGDRTCIVGTLGFSKVNAAISIAALLERFAFSELWHIGCAGGYNDGPMRIGDILITDCTVCGDEGILTKDGILSLREIGIPVIVQDGTAFYDELPLGSLSIMSRVRERVPPGVYTLSGNSPGPASFVRDLDKGAFSRLHASIDRSFRVVYGRSLTVGMTSGDAEIAAKRFECYRAFAENMEGSAVALACLRFGVPFIECRGISNIAGDRCKANWHLEEAVNHCLSIVLRWLD